jgi:hypothetical protein
VEFQIAAGLLFGGPLLDSPLILNGASFVDDYINTILYSASRALKSTWPLYPLSPVVKRIPQRTRLPGTIDNLWIDFDTISQPKGKVADQVEGHIVPVSPGLAIAFSGRRTPNRARRYAFVMIAGPSEVSLPPPLAGSATAGTQQYVVKKIYTALSNDEVVNPIFKWTYSIGSSASGLSVSLAPSRSLPFHYSSTVEVTITHRGFLSKEQEIVLAVSMSDDLHLLDGNGNQPKAGLTITLTQGLPLSPPSTHPPLAGPLSS